MNALDAMPRATTCLFTGPFRVVVGKNSIKKTANSLNCADTLKYNWGH